MRGMAELVDLRMRGYKPAFGVVWQVSDDPYPPYGDVQRTAYVKSPGPVDSEDLRAFVGLRVLCCGEKREAVIAACEAAFDAGAALVIGTVEVEAQVATPADVVFARDCKGDIEGFTWLP